MTATTTMTMTKNLTRTLPGRSLWRALAVCAGLAGLAGCGGGGDEAASPMPDTAVPVSALASPEAFAAYAGAAAVDESAEPLSLVGVEPPVSETAEPADVS